MISGKFYTPQDTKDYYSRTSKKFRLFWFLAAILNFSRKWNMPFILKIVRHRAILGKFLTPRVVRTLPVGPLKYFEFWQKWKISFISKTVRNRAISGKFRNPRVIRTTPLAPLKTSDFSNFQLPSWILVELVENVVFSKTIRDRVISGKFWTPMVSRTTSLLHLKNFYFSEFQPPSWILVEMKNIIYHRNRKRFQPNFLVRKLLILSLKVLQIGNFF